MGTRTRTVLKFSFFQLAVSLMKNNISKFTISTPERSKERFFSTGDDQSQKYSKRG